MSMMPPTSERELLDDLLIQHAIQGVSESEWDQMQELSRQFDLTDDDRFESVVASLDVALSSVAEDELPGKFSGELRQRIVNEAPQYLSSNASRATDSGPVDKVVLPMSTMHSTAGWTTREKWFGLAAAASLLIALASLSGRINPGPDTSTTATLTLAEQRSALLASGGSKQVVWVKNDDSGGLSPQGDVVWSDERQAGFLRIENLAVNDPAVQQYQLWIFDTERSDLLPVDGGVFDINSEGEVIVQIDAKLPITQAKMFAITIEKPGGVVQSKRERMPLLAIIEQAAP